MHTDINTAPRQLDFIAASPEKLCRQLRYMRGEEEIHFLAAINHQSCGDVPAGRYRSSSHKSPRPTPAACCSERGSKSGHIRGNTHPGRRQCPSHFQNTCAPSSDLHLPASQAPSVGIEDPVRSSC